MYMYIKVINKNGEQYDFCCMDAAVTTIKEVLEIQYEAESKGGHIEIEYIDTII